MHETVFFFSLDKADTKASIIDALLENGATAAEGRAEFTIDDQAYLSLNVTTLNEFDTRKLVALVIGELDEDETDAREIGRAIAIAGEYIKNEV